MTRIRFTPEAKLQLIAIWRYSAPRWGEATASRYLKAIDAVIRGVANGKIASRPYEKYGERLRYARSGSHNIYLRHDPEDGVLHVVGVLHQRQDPMRHLPQE